MRRPRPGFLRLPLWRASDRRGQRQPARDGDAASGWLRERLDEYVAGGGSKFIVRPMCPPEMMLDQLRQLAEEVVPGFHRR